MVDTAWMSDDAFAQYDSFLTNLPAEPALNEGTTRLRLIDSILFDVLHWDKNVVTAEEHIRDAGYADYVFLVKGIRSLVLEAKKVGTSFVLPEKDYPERAVPFSMIAHLCKDAHTAMQQAVRYANSLGARYTVISNGCQWLLMLTHVEGAQLTERNVLVFESLDAIKSKFPLFYNTFAPVGIRLNEPYGFLVDLRKQPAPAKLSASIARYPDPRTAEELRNKHATSIQMVWDEINNNERTPAFFNECYVPPRGHDKNQGIAKELLSIRRESDSRALEHIPAENVTHIIADYLPEKPVVLAGRIGHGKSTFITFLKTVSALEQLKQYIQIDIDFIDLPRTPEEVAEYVYQSIEEQLLEQYGVDVNENAFVRAALHGPLQRFRTTPRAVIYKDNATRLAEAELQFIEKQTGNRHTYLTRAIQHLKGGRGKSIAIFFDNLDKRPNAVQEEAFLLASAMARDWASLIFICLRPGTFNRSRETGVLDSIAPRIIQVNSPPMSLFLRRRFNYATAITDGSKKPPRGDVGGISAAMVAESGEVASLFASFSDSIQRNKELSNLLVAVANGNLRLALQYVGAIITSGHLNTSEMLDAISNHGNYIVATHQSLRAILFGDNRYYDPNRPPFLNLFDAEHADPLEHFVLPICLFHLAEVVQDSTTQGFISCDELAGKISAYTLTPQLIENAFALLHARKCIEDDIFSDDWSSTSRMLRISALGQYHISDLMARFLYLDAVVVATPIMDDRVRGRIRDVGALADRLSRARIFLRYLNDCAQNVINTPFYAHWERSHDAVAKEITEIENTITRESS
jgi:hypothetical protein